MTGFITFAFNHSILLNTFSIIVGFIIFSITMYYMYNSANEDNKNRYNHDEELSAEDYTNVKLINFCMDLVFPENDSLRKYLNGELELNATHDEAYFRHLYKIVNCTDIATKHADDPTKMQSKLEKAAFANDLPDLNAGQLSVRAGNNVSIQSILILAAIGSLTFLSNRLSSIKDYINNQMTKKDEDSEKVTAEQETRKQIDMLLKITHKQSQAIEELLSSRLNQNPGMVDEELLKLDTQALTPLRGPTPDSAYSGSPQTLSNGRASVLSHRSNTSPYKVGRSRTSSAAMPTRVTTIKKRSPSSPDVFAINNINPRSPAPQILSQGGLHPKGHRPNATTAENPTAVKEARTEQKATTVIIDPANDSAFSPASGSSRRPSSN